jgi:lipooligosaccharide transport system permease protein
MTALGGRGSVRRYARVGRLDWAALQGVLIREIVNFGSYWRGTTFSSTMEPTVYLLAFGFGFGSLVSRVGGHDYVDFVGTGAVATAVLFSAAFSSMFGTFVKATFQHTYDAILAAPVDTEEIVTAEALWMASRAGTYGCVPMLVAICFGLDPRIDMLVVPFVAFIAGFGWSCFGILIAGFMKGIENFSYVTSGILTPMMLTAGTFFPLSGLPEWAQVLGNFNPLHHCVELVRHSAFGWDPGADLLHLGALVLFAVVTWRIAVHALTRKLIT